MPVIRMEFARAGLAAAATSEAFLNQMGLLAEARAYGGGADLPRFAGGTLRRLERALTARGQDLRDAVFQLAHLLGAAAALDPQGRALDTLYGFPGPVRARALAAYLASGGARGHVRHEAEALALSYDGGPDYRLAHARLPLLMALLEFLLTAPDAPEQAGETMALVERIEAAPGCFETVRAASNALAASLGARLDRVMRSRVERDRFEALARHLDETAEEVEPGERRWRIDDGAVLSFWLRGAADPARAEDFRQFRTVHRAFVALILALREGEDFRRLHRPVAADDGESMLQIAERDAEIETLEEGRPSPLDALAADPAGRVKFLTGAEAKALEIPVRLWGAVRALPLSVMRSEVMGAAQNEIINALRFSRPLGPLVRLERLESDAAAGYGALRARYSKLGGHLGRMLLAAAHVAAERRGIALPEPRAAEARRAWRATRRQGFDGAFEAEGTGPAFDAALEPLADLARLMAGLEAALPEDTAALFAADRTAFAGAFAELYPQET